MTAKPRRIYKRHSSGNILRPKILNRNLDCPWLGCKETFKTTTQRDTHSQKECKFRPDVD